VAGAGEAGVVTADSWLFVAMSALVVGYGALAWGSLRADRRRQRRADRLVSRIKARGTITVVETEDGEPCCPHCGHSLRSAS
jgi:hypothetical protein